MKSPKFLKNLKTGLVFQIVTVIVFSLLLTRVLIEIIEHTTFSPSSWNRPRAKLFGSLIKDKASMLSNVIPDKGFDRSCFGYPLNSDSIMIFCAFVENGDTDRIIVVESLWDTLNSGKISVGSDQIRNAIQKRHRNNGNISNKWVIMTSRWDPFTGLRTSNLQKDNFVSLGGRLHELDGKNNATKGQTGLRWLQAVVDASSSGIRLNILFVGSIQLMIYFFAMITLCFMVVDTTVVLRNRKQLSGTRFLLESKEVVERKQIEKTLLDIQSKTKSENSHREFEPPIVSDALEPCLKNLLTYNRDVNRGELLANIETQGNRLQERLERRFQIIRYFVTAIPSLGFIGTVWGISEALGVTSTLTGESLPYERIHANIALGDSLKFAFDTTLVGLVAHIILSFALDWLESWEMSFVIDLRRTIVNRFSQIQQVISGDLK
jgi:biopolymer transport protein ExbB/TolQ